MIQPCSRGILANSPFLSCILLQISVRPTSILLSHIKYANKVYLRVA